jgi:hypothetical protein
MSRFDSIEVIGDWRARACVEVSVMANETSRGHPGLLRGRESLVQQQKLDHQLIVSDERYSYVIMFVGA